MEIDRRRFLSTAAVAGGVAALAGMTGCSPTVSSEEPSSSSPASVQEKSADIVVVGAGGAGLCAALTAEEGGASVILLEAMPMTGGATLGSTATNVAGSQMQKDADIEDTPEMIFSSYVKDLEDPNVIATAKMYSENNGETYDWLASSVGVKFSDEVQFFAPYPVARIVYPIGGGSGTVKTLTEKVNESSVELLLETTVTDLVKEGGTVVGVVAEGADGTEYHINAKAVILAAGGFAANRDMVPHETVKNAIYYGASSSDGKGFAVALHGGAKLKDLGLIPVEAGGLETSPGFGTQLYSVVLMTYNQSSAILVGPDGSRIVNETAPNPLLVKAYQSLPEETAYLFMDKKAYDVFYGAGTREVGGVFSAEEIESWLAADGKKLPLIVAADTIDEVASKAGVSSEGLKATIEAFNADASSGTDSVFGRSISAPIGEGPYCIVKQNLRYAHSFGGLIANERLEVLDWTETPIGGLYAAGQMLRSIQGQDSKPSTSTSFAYTSGRQAAFSALETL